MAIYSVAVERRRNCNSGIGGQIKFLQQLREVSTARCRTDNDCGNRDDDAYYILRRRGF